MLGMLQPGVHWSLATRPIHESIKIGRGFRNCTEPRRIWISREHYLNRDIKLVCETRFELATLPSQMVRSNQAELHAYIKSLIIEHSSSPFTFFGTAWRILLFGLQYGFQDSAHGLVYWSFPHWTIRILDYIKLVEVTGFEPACFLQCKWSDHS